MITDSRTFNMKLIVPAINKGDIDAGLVYAILIKAMYEIHEKTGYESMIYNDDNNLYRTYEYIEEGN